ncbi:MAG: tetratricopeptide repeat protein [Ardenticatenales bacterium]|nr:tetratricopeptide repeat protein [Ardenticatenales bacterium]
MPERAELENAMRHLETLRPTLGNAAVDAALMGVRQRLAVLHAAGPDSEKRKQVTVLFADLVSFTSMSERMDPEEMRNIVDRYFQHVTEPIVRLGGHVEKYIGDAIMAVFGVPTATENEPEHAISAALAMQQALNAFNDELEQERGIRLGMRVGINTGLVVLGYLGGRTERDITVVGDAVNVASRLQEAAPVGGVLISHETYRHVRGIFTVHSRGALQVKGKADPIQVYVVTATKPRAFRLPTRGVEGIETRMVGREVELQQLQQTLHTAIEGRTAHLVTVIGEAGVGKSRLLYEFTNWLELLPVQVRFFKGRASQEMMQLPYALLRNLFAFRFEIQDSDSGAVAREKLVQGIVSFGGEEEAAHFIGHLIGFDFSVSPHLQGLLGAPQQLYQRAVEHIIALFRRVAQARTAVIFLEDIHWADETSLSLFTQLLHACADLPLLLVSLTRRSLFERRPAWGVAEETASSMPRVTRMELQLLSQKQSQQLVGEILQRVDDVPADLEQLIIKTAEGNPFYVEELIKMLIEDEVIVKGEERWRVDLGHLSQIHVPPTLVGVLQARLDRLPLAERTTLQRASVVGRTFWDQIVQQLTSESSEATNNVDDLLGSLRGRELIYGREASAFMGTQEYIFKHALLRDVTYESVLKRLRRGYHARVARWLVERSGERINEYVGLIADHYERAGSSELAAAYLCQAGEQALQISALREARTFFERALLLVCNEPRPTSRLAHWQRLLTRHLGHTHFLMGNSGLARQRLEESLVLARRSEDQRSYVTTLSLLSRVTIELGDYAQAESYIEECLSLARELDDRSGLVDILRNLGNLCFSRGAYEQAQRHYQASLTVGQDIGYQAGITKALCNLGRLAIDMGEYEPARAYLEEGLRVGTVLGDRVLIAYLLGDLGQVAFYQGRYEDAPTRYEESLAIRREIGDQEGSAKIRTFLGDRALALGHIEEALGHYAESLAIRQGIGYKWGIAVSMAKLGTLACVQGNYSEAALLLYEALAGIIAIGAIPKALLILFAIATLHARLGHRERALELLGLILHHPASDVCETKGPASALLAELSDGLPPERVTVLLEQGRNREIEQIITELLAAPIGLGESL